VRLFTAAKKCGLRALKCPTTNARAAILSRSARAFPAIATGFVAADDAARRNLLLGKRLETVSPSGAAIRAGGKRVGGLLMMNLATCRL
jgi:hypothetical protein